jgi:cysteinyl-tRNA synthetase
MRAYLEFILILFLSSTPPAKRLYQAQDRFREALCDSFDTPSAVNVLRDLVSRTNVYIKASANELDVSVVEAVARWIGSMLRMFGLGEGDPSDLGWGQLSQDGSISLNVGDARHYHCFPSTD